VERIQLHMQASVMHTPTLTQELICQLLQTWGLPGFLAHVDSVVDYYRQQKDVMIAAANEHLSGK
jgi:kynurenine/2-aminoadipate aminotransferase